jgi:hypothetical protein
MAKIPQDFSAAEMRADLMISKTISVPLESFVSIQPMLMQILTISL